MDEEDEFVLSTKLCCGKNEIKMKFKIFTRLVLVEPL